MKFHRYLSDVAIPVNFKNCGCAPSCQQTGPRQPLLKWSEGTQTTDLIIRIGNPTIREFDITNVE